MTNSITSQILALVINIPNNDELKTYTVNKLFKVGYDDDSQNGLNLIVTWLVGEYGDLLLKTNLSDDKKVTDDVLVDYLLNLANLKNDNPTLISYILTSSLKLSSKVGGAAKSQLRAFIESKTKAIDLNIQIKAISYSVIFNEPDSIKQGLLDRMPPPPIKAKDTITLTNRISKPLPAAAASANSNTSAHKGSTKTEDLLLDLMDDGPSPSQPQSNLNESDLLNDIFSNNTPATSQSKSNNNDILGLFDSPQQPIQQSPQSNAIEAHKSDKVKVSFLPKQIGSGQAVIETQLENLSTSEISDLQLLIAVPKTQKLTMSSISSHTIQPFATVTQDLKIVGTPNSKIKLRIKFEYVKNGEKFTEQFDFGKLKQTI
ncbi:unnamed protein product [Wickerhamomyces anomalus]